MTVLDRPFRDFRLGCVLVLMGASTGLSSVVGISVSASAFVVAAGFDTDGVCGVLVVACRDFRPLGLPLFLGGGFDSTSTLLSELSASSVRESLGLLAAGSPDSLRRLEAVVASRASPFCTSRGSGKISAAGFRGTFTGAVSY